MREIQDGTALREYVSGDGSWDQSLMPVPWNTHSPALASLRASLPCYQTASLDSFQLCGQHQCRSCCIWPWPEALTVLSCDYIRACQPPRLSTCSCIPRAWHPVVLTLCLRSWWLPCFLFTTRPASINEKSGGIFSDLIMALRAKWPLRGHEL